MKKKNMLAYAEGVISIVVNILLFAIKYFAGVSTGSVAIIADAWHSLSDTLTSFVVIVGTKIAGKEADKEHPFGHGRVELIAAIIIGLLLTGVGFNFISEAIAKLRVAEQVHYSRFAIIAVAVSILVKEALAQFAFWAGKKAGSSSLAADGWHHRSDAISSAIILAGVFFGERFWWMDGVLGIIVSLLIFYAAFDVLKSAINPLIGERPNEEIVKKINDCVVMVAGDEAQMHHLHLHKYGRHKEVTFHIRLKDDMRLDIAHKKATDIEDEIRKRFDIESTIHIEPFNGH